jgi:hypothetical protein
LFDALRITVEAGVLPHDVLYAFYDAGYVGHFWY